MLDGPASDREAAGREASPTDGVLDSQTVKAPFAEARGYDGGKRIVGRKRHVAVDTDGRLLMVNLTPADPRPTRSWRATPSAWCRKPSPPPRQRLRLPPRPWPQRWFAQLGSAPPAPEELELRARGPPRRGAKAAARAPGSGFPSGATATPIRAAAAFICRRGHVTRQEVGRIQVQERERWWRSRPGPRRFAAAARHSDADDEEIAIAPLEAPARSALRRIATHAPRAAPKHAARATPAHAPRETPTHAPARPRHTRAARRQQHAPRATPAHAPRRGPPPPKRRPPR